MSQRYKDQNHIYHQQFFRFPGRSHTPLRSLLITSNLAFGEWGQILPGERMTAALLDRLKGRPAILKNFRDFLITKNPKEL